MSIIEQVDEIVAKYPKGVIAIIAVSIFFGAVVSGWLTG